MVVNSRHRRGRADQYRVELVSKRNAWDISKATARGSCGLRRIGLVSLRADYALGRTRLGQSASLYLGGVAVFVTDISGGCFPWVGSSVSSYIRGLLLLYILHVDLLN